MRKFTVKDFPVLPINFYDGRSSLTALLLAGKQPSFSQH
ncbi:Hypothetical protein ACI5QL_01475 [Bacillus velezensis]